VAEKILQLGWNRLYRFEIAAGSPEKETPRGNKGFLSRKSAT